MVKPTKKIGRQIGDELFECVWLFYGVGIWKVKDARRENPHVNVAIWVFGTLTQIFIRGFYIWVKFSKKKKNS